MTSLLRVKLHEKKEIISFLKENSKITEGEISNFFKIHTFHFDSKENSFIGWCIKDNNSKIKGFLGAIAHNSPYHQNKLIVNMTNWVVDKKFRSQSLALLRTFVNNKSNIYTNYSASKDVQKILPYFGFRSIDNGTSVYEPYKYLKLNLNLQFTYGESALKFFLRTKHERIIRDHLKMGGIFIRISNRGYLFFKKKNNIFNEFYLIHVINFSSKAFKNDWHCICSYSCFGHLVYKIFIDNRFSPRDIKPFYINKRIMFVKGLAKNSPVPTRLFSEPINILANFKNEGNSSISKSIVVRIAVDSDENTWNSYLLKKKKTVPISLFQLKFVAEKNFFFQKPIFFIAVNSNGKIKGSCACFLVKNITGKNKLYTPRFGFNADNSSIANLIFNYIKEFCKKKSISEFVCTSGFQNFDIKSHKFFKLSMIMELKNNYEYFWDNLRSKTRNAIRKSVKFNFKTSDNHIYLDKFYDIYKKTMLIKGVDILPLKFFKKLIKLYGDNIRLYSVFGKSDEYFGSLILIKGENIAQYTFAASIKNSNNAMHFLLSEVIKILYREGVKVFDMGESTKGGGVYLFKKFFGATEKKVYYYSTSEKSQIINNDVQKVSKNKLKNFFSAKLKNHLTRIM